MVQNRTLPAQIDPVRLAQHCAQLRGALALAPMLRLRQNLHDTSGSVEIDWQFTMDEQGRRWLSGTGDTQLSVTCQRCLQVFQVPLRVQTRLQIVSAGANEQADAESLLIDGDDPLVSLSDLVEDEILLALPLAPKHNEGQCVPVQGAVTAASSPQPAPAKQKPFALLRGLLPPKAPR